MPTTTNKAKTKRSTARTTGGWKTCSRGHKYRGTGPCPKCWPGGQKRGSGSGN